MPVSWTPPRGTGNMGQILAQTDYRKLDGMEPSSAMLQIDRRKHICRLLLLYFGAKVGLADLSRDALEPPVNGNVSKGRDRFAVARMPVRGRSCGTG